MVLPTPPKLGHKICHQEVAFPQVPAWHVHSAGSRGCLRGWSQPEEKGQEVWAAGVGRKAQKAWRRRKDS